MKIIYESGDLFASSHPIMLHSCNQQGVMGSGVAKIVRENYPEAFTAYRQTFTQNGLQLGEIIWAQSGVRIIGNAVTQEFYGRNPNLVYVSYEAIKTVMMNVNTYMADKDTDIVAMPTIGAGLANGSWKTISEIIEQYSTFQPVVYLLDGKIPTS